jgi:hypothetical protein
VDICFDTSAFNALCDDPDASRLSQGIRKSHRILISSVNIVEVVGTPDQNRRRALIECMRSVWDETRPLVMPNKLIGRATRAFVRPRAKVMLTITSEDAPFWQLLNHPEDAGAAEQAEALAWKDSLEVPFKEAHREGRPSFQELFERDPSSRPRSVSDLIRSFADRSKGGGAMYDVVRQIFKKETGTFLSRDAMWRLFLMVPHWPLYLAGWGHEMFTRAMRLSHYGPKGKPGSLDLWCAVYLPHCDEMVTNDKGQYRALRLLNVLSKRVPPGVSRTRVLTYQRFRREIIG